MNEKDRRSIVRRSGFLLTAVILAAATPALGQTAPPAPQQQNSATPTFSYDAVTIKPDPDGVNRGFMKHTADGFSMGGMPVVTVIRTAYGVLMDDQLIGLPGWAKSDPITIQAKMDAETAAALAKLPAMEQWKQSQLMLQALLADRFALKVHHETKDLPIYVLTIAKGGCRMKQTAADKAGGNASYASGKITAHGISVDNLVMNLSFIVGRVIVNKTGLESGYDFTLDYAPDGADSSDTRPSIFTALEEQLGLKLEPARGPVDVIVIDHIERPTAN
jgi:uncharacterized protein (TIGR03435 family)